MLVDWKIFQQGKIRGYTTAHYSWNEWRCYNWQ